MNMDRSVHEERKRWILVIAFALAAFSVAVAEPSEVELRQQVVEYSKTLMGIPYVYGASAPPAFDCSGFVNYVYKKAIASVIPRNSKAIFAAGVPVERSIWKAGDVIVFDTVGGAPSHVAIYLGDETFIHAASDGPKTGVIVSTLKDRYFGPRIIGARSFIERDTALAVPVAQKPPAAPVAVAPPPAKAAPVAVQPPKPAPTVAPPAIEQKPPVASKAPIAIATPPSVIAQTPPAKPAPTQVAPTSQSADKPVSAPTAPAAQPAPPPASAKPSAQPVPATPPVKATVVTTKRFLPQPPAIIVREEPQLILIGFDILPEPSEVVDKIPAAIGTRISFAITNKSDSDGIFIIYFYKADIDPKKNVILREDRAPIVKGGFREIEPYLFQEPGLYRLIVKTSGNDKMVDRSFRVIDPTKL